MAEQTTHSPIGASSYHRWSKTHGGCPASIKLSEGIVSPESSYALEGTLAHEIAANILDHHFNSMGAKYVIPHGTTAQTLEFIKVYTDFIKREAKLANAQVEKGHVLIEHKIHLKDIDPNLYGTADAVIYYPREKKLLVADFKFGAGLGVEVEENLQLMYYALGCIHNLDIKVNTVELAVIQPRFPHPEGPIRKWEIPIVRMLDFEADLLEDVKATREEKPLINPGEHCRFCPAAATNCPALKEKAMTAAKAVFTDISHDPKKIAEALDMIPAVESFIKKVREFAYQEAVKGNPPPGYKLVNKRGTRKWSAPEEIIVDYLKNDCQKSEDQIFERKLKSPYNIEKEISKQLGIGLRKYVQTVVSGYNLVPVSDKRPEAVLDSANDFTIIDVEDEA